ncbi:MULTISPECIES: TIGR00153 family protein [unclassified Agarivorans]|uniref:TIGR00153 family protein n=1 Tax=unclassified Agarivorans TaxID=2636026 RepID=UPI0010E74327|nr:MULTISPECIES: TIGR00153 family protein [unclassified Agarivorans]MDO6685247.1 TIGR00153 family protein [Agarivorans sp. 3_MG-2023]MDO6715581.1 TIGR00153 family protein [Agarivorans sp. 2_MG-2023]MDO6763728.1 TIGR00153 family protein [Agarivorans sp. 1_MG-2023]GDY27152.1 phosphate transport regulator [Agarivorans sp. Toyoura001]
MSGNTILGLFAKSPIKPLEEHINVVHECCEVLVPFFEAVLDKDWKTAAKRRRDISNLEKEADRMKREIRLNLPGGIFMPIERSDVLELLTHQDRIANKAKDISGRMLGRKMELPPKLAEMFMAYLARCLEATGKAKDAINELEDLLETGFRGREVDLVKKMVHELDVIEDDTDAQQIKIRRKLQKIEKKLDPIDAMFLYFIIEAIGELADQAQRVGARLELMIYR